MFDWRSALLLLRCVYTSGRLWDFGYSGTNVGQRHRSPPEWTLRRRTTTLTAMDANTLTINILGQTEKVGICLGKGGEGPVACVGLGA